MRPQLVDKSGNSIYNIFIFESIYIQFDQISYDME